MAFSVDEEITAELNITESVLAHPVFLTCLIIAFL
jgi:hypothetical protein